jgi:hypothetical protein
VSPVGQRGASQHRNTAVKQYHKEGRALRTETTILGLDSAPQCEREVMVDRFRPSVQVEPVGVVSLVPGVEV